MGAYPVSPNSVPAFVDTGQGPVGRIASWSAWTADPTPLQGPEQTRIWRQDDNGAGIGEVGVPLGKGGCGSWGPVLDGSSNGATSGGDNCFYLYVPPAYLTTDAGASITDDFGNGIWGEI